MSKALLIGSLVACFLAVGLIAVLTPTVIVDNDGDHGGRILRVEGSFPAPGPGSPVPGPGNGGPRSLPMPGVQAPKLPGLQRMKMCVQRESGTPGGFRTCMGLPSFR